MSNTIKIKRGNKINIPSGGTEEGELRFALDTKELYIDDGVDNIQIGVELTNGISDEVQTELDNKADKVSGATNGNLATLNATGNLLDSGVASNDVVQPDSIDTLLNKTIDLDNNTLSNIETDNFKAGVISTGALNNDKIPSQGYVDDRVNLVKVSSNDTTTDYLEGKINGSGATTVTTLNDGADETLQISSTDQKVSVSGNDTTPSDLESKIVAGTNVSIATLNEGTNETLEISASAPDEKLKVSANDTTADYAENKFVAGSNITLTVLNEGANETIEITASGGAVGTDENVKVSANDTTAGYLEQKIVAGTGISLATLNEGADEDFEISASIDWGDIGGTLSNQTDLQSALDAKADDSAVVKLTGSQTVGGEKTFSEDLVTDKALVVGNNIVTVAVGKTLALTDAGYEQNSTSATAIDITVPLNSSVAFPIGTEIPITKYGTGDVTIVATGGVTINTQDNLIIDTQYDSRILKKIATDEWLLKKSSGGGGINYLTEESLKAAEDLTQGDFIEKFGDKARKAQLVRDDFIENTKYVYDSSAIVRDIVMLTDTKFVVSYVKKVTTGKLWCIIGDIAADDSITYGTRVEYYDTASSSVDIRHAKLARLADDKFVMIYMGLASGSADYYSSIVSTVSGTAITKGTVYNFDSTGLASDLDVETLDTDKFIIIYDRSDSTEQGIVGTVSGTVISYGSRYQAASGGSYLNNIALKLTTDKIVMGYGSNVRIVSVSGTVITYGTEYSKNMSKNLGVLASDKLILIESGQIQTGDVSGTDITFNTQYTVSSTGNYLVCFDSNVAYTTQQKMNVDSSDVITIGKLYTRVNTTVNKQINKDSTSYKVMILSTDGVLVEDVYHKLGFASDNVLSGNTGTFFTENK